MANALNLFNDGITVEVPENCPEGARLTITEASAITDVWFKTALADDEEIGDGVVYRPYRDPIKAQWVGTLKSFVRPGTTCFIADGAITAFATVYAADDGKVAATGTVAIGKALNDAADGGRVDVLYVPAVYVPAADDTP